MKYLVYGIFTNSTSELKNWITPIGVNGQPINILRYQQLNVAVSHIEQLVTEVSALLAYHQVIELIYVNQTVIPMRYGCLFNTSEEIYAWLAKDYQQYQEIIQEIDGCVEMSIRVLFSAVPSVRSPPIATSKTSSGKTYLTKLQKFYADTERVTHEQANCVAHIIHALQGHFKQSKQEPCAAKSTITIYFLVPKQEFEDFRKIFHILQQNTATKLLLSGPWPPYNFVVPKHSSQG